MGARMMLNHQICIVNIYEGSFESIESIEIL